MKTLVSIVTSLFALCCAAAGTAVSGSVQTFAAFADRAWVAGEGTVTRILEDDLDPPCHQRFILADATGRTILVAHNIDRWPRVAYLAPGDRVSFCGEFVANERGGLVHWTHPDPSGVRPGGWVRRVSDAAAEPEASHIVRAPTVRKEYFAGCGPISGRTPAPVNDDWPETGWWLSTNSDTRHNPTCENYRRTRGYPCDKTDGRPCGKCGG